MHESIILQIKVKKPTDTEGTIVIRAFLNRRPIASKSTGQRIQVKHWLAYSRCLVEYAPNAALINLEIAKQLQEIKRRILEKQLMGMAITASVIKDAMAGHDTGADFYLFCKERIQSDYTNEETKKWLLAHVDKLKAFRPTLAFSGIDYKFLDAYKKYCIQERTNTPNTVWSSLKFLKTMITKAIKQGGIITADPFDQFDRGVYTQTHKEPLNLSDINEIEKIIDREDIGYMVKAVAVRFLLMAYSGMRFSDALKRFNPALHIKNDRLVMTYSKFSEKVNYPLFPRLKRIIDLLPQYPLKISNTQFNNFLAAIAGLCRINKHLTSHIGRHTMGFILADMNIPKEKAQKILGHKKESSTDIYYHVTDDQVDREVRKLNDL